MSHILDPVIGQCRKCHADLFESHPYVWCAVCNEPIPDAVNVKRKPNVHAASTASSSGLTPNIANASSAVARRLSALMNRYNDAYLVARTVDGYGSVVKAIGIIAATILCLIGFVWFSSGRAGDGSFAMGIVTVAFGLFVGTLFYLIGVLISAQGQILKASLDSAVNNSPFLTNEHRARIMSLPEADDMNTTSEAEKQHSEAANEPVINVDEEIKARRRAAKQCEECGTFLGLIEDITGNTRCKKHR